MFLTENLATIILFVSYIFAMLVFLISSLKNLLHPFFTNSPFFLTSCLLLPSPLSTSPYFLFSFYHFPSFLLHLYMNLLFLHHNPFIALFQLVFISFFLIIIPIYFHSFLSSFYFALFKIIHRYFFPLPIEPSIHPDIIMDWIWLHYFPHRHS